MIRYAELYRELKKPEHNYVIMAKRLSTVCLDYSCAADFLHDTLSSRLAMPIVKGFDITNKAGFEKYVSHVKDELERSLVSKGNIGVGDWVSIRENKIGNWNYNYYTEREKNFPPGSIGILFESNHEYSFVKFPTVKQVHWQVNGWNYNGRYFKNDAQYSHFSELTLITASNFLKKEISKANSVTHIVNHSVQITPEEELNKIKNFVKRKCVGSSEKRVIKYFNKHYPKLVNVLTRCLQ